MAQQIPQYVRSNASRRGPRHNTSTQIMESNIKQPRDPHRLRKHGSDVPVGHVRAPRREGPLVVDAMDAAEHVERRNRQIVLSPPGLPLRYSQSCLLNVHVGPPDREHFPDAQPGDGGEPDRGNRRRIRAGCR